MPKVINTNANAPASLHGPNGPAYLFTEDRGGQRISQDLPDDVAAYFASLPGFLMVKPAEPSKGKGGKGKDGAAAPDGTPAPDGEATEPPAA